MARYSRTRAPLKSVKHEITFSSLVADVGTATLIIPIWLGQDTTTANLSTEAVVGRRIKSVYIEFNCSAASVANPKILHWTVQGGSEGSTLESPALYNQSNKANIIKRGMEMLPVSVGTVYKRIFQIRIPRKFQRVQQDGFLSLLFRCSSTETINVCGIIIYKELY